MDDLAVAGMMSMCVDTTVRAGADLGFRMMAAGNASATPALEFDGRKIDDGSVQAAFVAALADGYAAVVSGNGLLSQRAGSR